MQSVVTGQAPTTAAFFLLCSICTEYYEALLGWNTRSRCADQICYPYVRLPFWRGECLCHRSLGVWLFCYNYGEYVKNSVYRRSAYILWADGLTQTTTCTSKTLRSTTSSVLLFVNVFFFGGGCTPFLSSAQYYTHLSKFKKIFCGRTLSPHTCMNQSVTHTCAAWTITQENQAVKLLQ